MPSPHRTGLSLTERSRPFARATLSSLGACHHLPRHTVSNDGVTKLSPFTHGTCRLSNGHVDGVEAVRHRDDDAVDATEVRKSSEITLSHAFQLDQNATGRSHGFPRHV